VKCGTTGAFERTVCVQGKLRKFIEYVPATATCDTPPPLIVFLHGNGGDETGGDVARTVADDLGAVYLTPRGVDQGGFLGFGPEAIPNSRTFVTMAMSEIEREFPTDPQSALLTGFSGGGFFAAYCIAWLNSRLAGVGIFAAGLGEYWEPELSAAPIKLPVFIRVGDQDSLQSTADSLVNQLRHTGWPAERIDSQRFQGGHKWSPEMIRAAYDWAKAFAP
jgi:predicted esterase